MAPRAIGLEAPKLNDYLSVKFACGVVHVTIHAGGMNDPFIDPKYRPVDLLDYRRFDRDRSRIQSQRSRFW